MPRERDVRNAIQAALVATNAFSDVLLTGLPENYGAAASDLAMAVIEPKATNFTTGWDAAPSGDLDFTAQLSVTILARHPDPQLRDELAEQLLSYLQNAVNGATLVSGFTVPQKTLVGPWRWVDATPPERRIIATVSFAYLVSWQGWDTSQ